MLHHFMQIWWFSSNFSFNLNNNETQNISNIISLNFSENSFHSINLFTVHKNGTIIQTTFNNTNGNFVNQSITVASNQLITSDPNSIVSFGTNKFACVTSSGSGLFVAQIDSNNAEQTRLLHLGKRQKRTFFLCLAFQSLYGRTWHKSIWNKHLPVNDQKR